MTSNKSNIQKGNREHFSSRLGFILISAGCAIGLGNVWKFPYQVGQYGGAAFLILYIICLILIALPVLIMEFGVGRAAQVSNALAFNKLEPKKSKWHNFKWVTLIGQYLLMMFYTTVCGWMFNYVVKEASGCFENANADTVSLIYNNMVANPGEMIFWMVIVVAVGMAICIGGVQKGIEKITKVMMLILLGIMILLAIFAVSLPNGDSGLRFYLMPNFDIIFSSWESFTVCLYQAMSLAFFTLSVGMGSMVIFGSYINKERSLYGEALTISILDVSVAVIAGLIVFPACFSYGVNPGSGPSLVFETLPNVFANMACGSILGALFFVFLSFAALSTVIAVFENVIAFWMDLKGWSRKKSVIVNCILIIVLSLPCALGFNILSWIQIPQIGLNTIMDIEDFIISNNVLPLGGIFFTIFCTSKRAWGWKKAIKEINSGKGLKLPNAMYVWVKYIVPVFILFIFIMGWISAFK